MLETVCSWTNFFLLLLKFPCCLTLRTVSKIWISDLRFHLRDWCEWKYYLLFVEQNSGVRARGAIFFRKDGMFILCPFLQRVRPILVCLVCSCRQLRHPNQCQLFLLNSAHDSFICFAYRLLIGINNQSFPVFLYDGDFSAITFACLAGYILNCWQVVILTGSSFWFLCVIWWIHIAHSKVPIRLFLQHRNKFRLF